MSEKLTIFVRSACGFLLLDRGLLAMLFNKLSIFVFIIDFSPIFAIENV
jgi:hypothetical protein